jgi:hypothetical protein
MRFRVLHNPKFLYYHRGTVPALADCVVVAELECASIEDAFTLTNTVEKPWWENENVNVKFGGDACRSTSVGDVIVDLDTNEHYVVQMFGFLKADADGNIIQG